LCECVTLALEDVDGNTYPICALGILSSILKKVDVVGLRSLVLLFEYFFTLWMHLVIHDNSVVLSRCNEIGNQYVRRRKGQQIGAIFNMELSG